MIVATGFLLAACSTSVRLPKQHAYIYGVAGYGHGINDLLFTDNDAVQMRDLLQSKGYEVTFRLSADSRDYPEPSTSQLPTRSQLIADLEHAARTLTEDDSFLLYFSGHGGRLHDFGGPVVSDVSEPYGHSSIAEYLFMYNDIDTSLSAETLPEIAIKDDELGELLAAIPARVKVVVIDACNAGGLIGTSPSVDTVPQEYSGITRATGGNTLGSAVQLYFSTPDDVDVTYRDATVLAAAGADELAYEDDWREVGIYDGNGKFTSLFLQGAEDGDRNGDGFVTTIEMYDYIGRHMDERHNADMRLGMSAATWKYRPRLSGGAVDYILFPVD